MRRREFLRAATQGVAAGLVLPSLLAPEAIARTPAKWKMRLSTSSIHYLQLPVEQACEKISALKFEAVDIWSAHAGCPHLDDTLHRLGPERLTELLARLKLSLFAFSVYQGGFARYAELLGEVGGGVAVRGSSQPCKPNELIARMRDFLERLKPEVELAERHDAYLAIENHGNALLDSLDSFKAFVDLNNSPRLGIAMAPYHLQALGAPVEQAIAISGRQLFFFYAWQRAKGIEQLPGHGPTDFTPWIAALANVGYGGCVNPFMHGEVETSDMSAALAKSRDYLKRCHESAVERK
jgi:sugar phosphate isomerase/epimerase